MAHSELEDIRESGLSWEDRFKVYSENLLDRLNKTHPQTPLSGRFTESFFGRKKDKILFYTIRHSGRLVHYNPFFKKLLRVIGSSSEEIIKVFGYEFGEDIEKITEELNKLSGRKYKVAYYAL